MTDNVTQTAAMAPQTLFIPTPANGNNAPAGFPKLDLLDFNVATTPMFIANPNMPNMAVAVPPHIANAIIRADTGKVLATCKGQHINVQHQTLHEHVKKALTSVLPASYLNNVLLTESESGDSSFVKMIYRTPDLKGIILQSNGKKTEMDLQISVVNAPGSRAVTVIQTGFDHSCENHVPYTSEKFAMQHTEGMDLGLMEAHIRKVVHDFPAHLRMIQGYALKEITSADFKRILHHNSHISTTAGENILCQFAIEAKNRGSNLYAGLSALAAWSTHNDGNFYVRNSANSDNEARSLFARQEKVMKLIGSNAFQEVAA